MGQRVANRIVVFGDVIDDIVVVPRGIVRSDTDTASAITHAPGGSAANAASWLTELGADVDFVGRVGAADVAHHARVLREARVTPHLIGDDELPTGTIVVIVDGNSRTMFTDGGANARFTPDDVTDELLDVAAAVHFTGYSVFRAPNLDPMRRLLQRAAAREVLVSVDPASAGYIEDFGAQRFLDAIAGVDILFPNLDEGRALTGLDQPEQIVRALAAAFPVVALTMGADGVMVAANGSEPEYFTASPSTLVDPTGAGDAFGAGFLTSWLQAPDVAAAARAGSQASARAVGMVGGRPTG